MLVIIVLFLFLIWTSKTSKFWRYESWSWAWDLTAVIWQTTTTEKERERANRSIRSSNNPFPQWGDPPRPDPKLDWAMINEQFIYQRFFLLSVTGEVVVFHNRNNWNSSYPFLVELGSARLGSKVLSSLTALEGWLN